MHPHTSKGSDESEDTLNIGPLTKCPICEKKVDETWITCPYCSTPLTQPISVRLPSEISIKLKKIAGIK